MDHFESYYGFITQLPWDLSFRNCKLEAIKRLMTESAVALGSITKREGGGVGGGQADDGKR